MIIDKTKEEFVDVPATLDDEVLLERPAAGGFITCSQEVAYMHAVATLEQATVAGHNNYDYTKLNLAVCRKPDINNVIAEASKIAQDNLNSINIPEQAKAGLQNRITNIATDVQSLNLDDALRLSLQLTLDVVTLNK